MCTEKKDIVTCKMEQNILKPVAMEEYDINCSIQPKDWLTATATPKFAVLLETRQ